MAKLKRMPDSATIIACRKRVDFYEWKGIPVARRWPTPHGPRVRSAAEQATNDRFTAAVKMAGASDGGMREWWRLLEASAIGATWVDAQRATAMGKPWMRLLV